jgi:hypothetical protein
MQERDDADPIPNEAALVSEMLVKTGLAGTENWIVADDFVDPGFEIAPRWRGKIPVTAHRARRHDDDGRRFG